MLWVEILGGDLSELPFTVMETERAPPLKRATGYNPQDAKRDDGDRRPGISTTATPTQMGVCTGDSSGKQGEHGEDGA